MSPPARPTTVSVIGWVWCILGTMMASSGALALVVSLWQPPISEPPWSWMPVLAPIQILIGLTGAVAGFWFLRLEPWTRRVLVVLTVITLVMLVSVNVFVGSMWTRSMEEAAGDTDLGPFRYFGVIVATISTLLYGGGLVFMLHCLRGAEVRDALRRPTTE
jgi:hypothetical protein